MIYSLQPREIRQDLRLFMGHDLLCNLFTVIVFAVTLVMGNYYSIPDQIIQDRKNSLKDEKKQCNTQKTYQDFLDIVLSAQVNLLNLWACSYI